MTTLSRRDFLGAAAFQGKLESKGRWRAPVGAGQNRPPAARVC
jgi:hypothetical protein